MPRLHSPLPVSGAILAAAAAAHFDRFVFAFSSSLQSYRGGGQNENIHMQNKTEQKSKWAKNETCKYKQNNKE